MGVGVYGTWAEKYYESGFYTVPCGGKAPFPAGWTDFCEKAPSEKQVVDWIKKYPDANQIGLLLGPSTGIVAFDFDYDFNPKKCPISEDEFKKDRSRIEKEIMELLPPSDCGKVGRKGWTRLYKWNSKLINKNTNRNGVRLFDFLSTGRQTIIPPSLHSVVEDKKISYRWMDSDLFNAGGLPELSMETIETIISLYSDRPKGQRPPLADLSRHERVMYFIYDALKVDNNLTRVAEFAIEYDKKVNKEKPYLTDTNYYDEPCALKNARSFTEKINKWAIRNEALKTPAEKKAGKGLTKTSWNHFFETSFHKIRKDTISKKCFYKLDEDTDWGVMDEVEGVLRSYAGRRGLTVPKTLDELARWSLEKTETDFLCDIPKWDGVDRLAEFGRSVTSPNFTGDEIGDILKQWGSNIFRRVKSADHQNRCVILKGPQGLGKDYFVRAMLRDFKPYYESTTMPGTQKDALEICSRLLAVHIEEFDQTKHMDMAFMKSLITQPSAFFRESYGASPNQKIMRPSFISTANVDDILRDPTGNRRFVVVPVTGIDWNYPKDCSLQVLAQWRAHHEAGEFETLPATLEAKIKEIIEAYTPEDLSATIIDLYEQKMQELTSKSARYGGRLWLTGKEFAEPKLHMAKLANCGVRKIESVIKNAGLSHRYSEGVRYYKFIDTLVQDRRNGVK